MGVKMKSFYDLPEIVRFQVYGALTALDCDTGKSGGSGQLCVAVARGKFGELCKTLDKNVHFDWSFRKLNRGCG